MTDDRLPDHNRSVYVVIGIVLLIVAPTVEIRIESRRGPSSRSSQSQVIAAATMNPTATPATGSIALPGATRGRI